MIRHTFIAAPFAVLVLLGASPLRAIESEENRVGFMRLGSCCAAIAWPRGEEALMDELQMLAVSLQVIAGETPFNENVADHFQRLQTGVNVDVLIRLWTNPDNRLQLDIQLFEDTTAMDVRTFTFENARTEDVLESIVLSGVEEVRAVLQQRADARELPQEAPTSSTTEPTVPPVPALPSVSPPQPDAQLDAHPVAVADAEEQKVRRFGLGFGGAIVGGPGGVGVGAGLLGGVTMRPRFPLLLALEVLMMPVGGDVQTVGNDAALKSAGIRATVHATLVRGKTVGLALGGSVGATLAWLRSAGQLEIDKLAYLGTAMRLDIKITASIGLVFAGRGGVLLPQVEVLDATSSVARWGRPIMEGAGQLEFRF